MTKSYLNFKGRINILTGGILIIWALFIFKLSEIQIINAKDKTQGLRQLRARRYFITNFWAAGTDDVVSSSYGDTSIEHLSHLLWPLALWY